MAKALRVRAVAIINGAVSAWRQSRWKRWLHGSGELSSVVNHLSFAHVRSATPPAVHGSHRGCRVVQRPPHVGWRRFAASSRSRSSAGLDASAIQDPNAAASGDIKGQQPKESVYIDKVTIHTG